MRLSPAYMTGIRSQLNDICERYLEGEDLIRLIHYIESRLKSLVGAELSLDNVFDTAVASVDSYEQSIDSSKSAFIKNQFLILKNKYRVVQLAEEYQSKIDILTETVSGLEVGFEQQKDQLSEKQQLIDAQASTIDDLTESLRLLTERVDHAEELAATLARERQQEMAVATRDCFGRRRRGPGLLAR